MGSSVGLLVSGALIKASGVQGLGFRVWGSGISVWGSGSGFRV